MGLSIVPKHHGNIELQVFEVAKCGGEISFACFLQCQCRHIDRVCASHCENRIRLRCGTTDADYRGRWYIPCGTLRSETCNGWQPFGCDRSILDELRNDLHGEHCVVPWCWTGAHRCDIPTMIAYYGGKYGVGVAGAEGVQKQLKEFRRTFQSGEIITYHKDSCSAQIVRRRTFE